MKNTLLILLLLIGTFGASLTGQNITLTFTGDNNGQSVLLDSVFIRNVTQGGEISLYPPDLTLTLILTGTDDHMKPENRSINLNQNHPNPFSHQTEILLQIPEKGWVGIGVSNVMGQILLDVKNVFAAGTHTLTFSPGKETCYLLTVKSQGQTQTIKMLCNAVNKEGEICLNHTGYSGFTPEKKSGLMFGELPFEAGDKLLIIGYSEYGESGMVKSPETSQEYIIQFATNVPCPGVETVAWEGQSYNTIQVFGQCWFKENLNAGVMITSSQPQANNQIIEKYCMGNLESFCDIAGGLYFWNEMMQYENQTGGQGICPEGWHIPDDFDWQILEGAVDSAYKIGDPEWYGTGWRGSDAGGNLKQTGTTYWEYPNAGATDAFGFKALPAGYFVQNEFWGPGYKAYLWSSKYPQKYYRNMDWNQTKVNRAVGGGEAAFSVRCIKN